MQLIFNITLRNFIFIQFAIASFVVFSGLASYLFTHITGYGRLLGLLRLFDVGAEESIPTYFSLLNILLSAILLFIIFVYEKSKNNQGYRYWLFLSFLFILLSADESVGIHENFALVHEYLVLNEIIPRLLTTHQWLPFGIFFIVLIGIILIPFLKSLPKTTFYYFSISAVIFITGAVGFEYMGAVMLETGFVDSRTDIIYRIRRIFEEGFEIYGIVIFNCALYREIINRNISLLINTEK